MDFYKKLPDDFLIAFHDEIMKNIEKGILTKNVYYELGLIISVANQRGITLNEEIEDLRSVNEIKDFTSWILN